MNTNTSEKWNAKAKTNPDNIYKSNVLGKISPVNNISRVVNFPVGRDPAPVSGMRGVIARWFAELKIPIHADPDRALQHDDYYRLLRSCPAYDRARRRALPKIAGNVWDFQASEESHENFAKIWKKIFKKIKGFDSGRKKLADALFEGRSWLKIQKWGFVGVKLPNGYTMKVKVPVELIPSMKEAYELQSRPSEDGNGYEWLWTEQNLKTGRKEVISEADMYNYITVAYDAELRNRFQGEALQSYAIGYIKAIAYVVNYAMVHAEKKAEVVVAIKSNFTNMLFTELQNAIAADKDASSARIQNLLNWFKNQKQGGTILLGQDDDAQVIDTAGQAQNIYIALLEYLNKELETWILATLGGMDSDEGSYAKASVSREEQNDHLAWYQRSLVIEPIQELVRRIYFYVEFMYDAEGNVLLDGNGKPRIAWSNWQEFAKLGFSEYELPEFILGEVGKDEPADLVPIYTLMQSLGAPIDTEQLYNDMRRKRPEGVPDVIKPPAPQQAPGGGDGMPQMPGMMAEKFDESEHPRESDGKFAKKEEGEESGKNDIDIKDHTKKTKAFINSLEPEIEEAHKDGEVIKKYRELAKQGKLDRPVLVDRKTGNIIDGNHTIYAAQQEGVTVPIYFSTSKEFIMAAVNFDYQNMKEETLNWIKKQKKYDPENDGENIEEMKKRKQANLAEKPKIPNPDKTVEPTNKEENRIMSLLKQAKKLLNELIFQSVINKRDNKDSIAVMLTYIQYLSGLMGLDKAVSELQQHKVDAVEFSEEYPTLFSEGSAFYAEYYSRGDETPKSRYQDKKIRERLAEDFKLVEDWGKVQEQVDSFNKKFDEAINTLTMATPMLGSSEDLRRYYYEGLGYGKPIFGAAQADTIEKVNKLQNLLTQFLETGKTETVERDIQSVMNSTASYAENVFRTNTATAYSIGKQIKYKPLEDNGFIVGYQFLTAHDTRVRSSHAGNHGALISVKNDDLNKLQPPLGFQCYDKYTEVLTDKGWKLFSELKGNEKFFSLNPDDKNVEWVKAVNYICQTSQKMFRFKGKSIDLYVTPEHQMLIATDYNHKHNNSKLEFRSAEDACSSNALYRSSEWQGKEPKYVTIGKTKIESEIFCKFMAYYLSEGSTSINKAKSKNSDHQYTIKIAQKDPTDIYEDIKGLPYKLWLGKEAIYIKPEVELAKYLMKFGKGHKKYIPKVIKNMSKRLIRIFLDAYNYGDGSKVTKTTTLNKREITATITSYFTSSNQMAADLGELIVKSGKGVHYSQMKIKGKLQKFSNGTYRINHNVWRLIENKTIWQKFGKHIEVVDNYNDFVYCVELEKYHTLFVRRNGRTAWCGNCRCLLRPISRIEAESKGWLNENGTLKEWFPPTYNPDIADKGFGVRVGSNV